MHSDDLKNPDYRKGRRNAAQPAKSAAIRPPSPTEDERRAQFAVQVARAEFGRFYWNDALERRMERELKKARQQRREVELTRRRRHNGPGK